MTATYPTRTAWKIARNAYAKECVEAARPYIDDDPAAVPDWCLGPGMTAADWVAMSPGLRVSTVSHVARAIFDAEVPRPAPAVPIRLGADRAVSVSAPAPAREPEPAPAPAPTARAWVLCGRCGEYVATRPGRPTVTSTKKNCLHA